MIFLNELRAPQVTGPSVLNEAPVANEAPFITGTPVVSEAPVVN